MFGAALFVLGKIFWPQTILVKIGFELGTAFEAIALALGLADRIRLANEERDLAQRRILEETRSLNVAYARFVPREFLELLGKDDVREVRLGEAVQREMTVLFSDIRSFTTISEKMTPRENFDFLNGYLERVGPIVRQYRGVIDKYIGDAIMGLFAGRRMPTMHCAARSDCSAKSRRSTSSASPRAWPRSRSASDCTPGTLMLGTIGESERMDGTVIADAVNLASRVEGLTKNYGAAVLLTEQTRDRLADPSRYALRHLGRVAVKGKAHGVGLYEACDADAPPSTRGEERDPGCVRCSRRSARRREVRGSARHVRPRARGSRGGRRRSLPSKALPGPLECGRALGRRRPRHHQVSVLDGPLSP